MGDRLPLVGGLFISKNQTKEKLPMHEKFEKLKHDLYVGEHKLRATEDEGKAL